MKTRLAIDIGNTLMKAGIFEGHDLVWSGQIEKNKENLEGVFARFSPGQAAMSSVGRLPDDVMLFLQENTRLILLDAKTPMPITIRYASPDTLGADRIAAAAGAAHIFPKENCLVIDMGTCITYEFLDEQGAYWGGGISPGMNMRFKAMNAFTAKLPLLSMESEPPVLIGDSTASCMRSGVFYGILHELEGLIAAYTARFGEIRVLLCGGDAVFFETNIKARIFAQPDIILFGLNSIMLYNGKNF